VTTTEWIVYSLTSETAMINAISGVVDCETIYCALWRATFTLLSTTSAVEGDDLLQCWQYTKRKLSPGLVVTTTSRRFLLAYTGFQYASELSTRRQCLYGSVCTMCLAIWLICVCRPTPCMVASNCVPRRLVVCIRTSTGSAASPSMDHERRTVCQLNSQHQTWLCAPSSVISRPTCFSSS